MKKTLFAPLLFATLAGAVPVAAARLSQSEALVVVKVVDERQSSGGDYRSLCYVKDTERGKEPRLFQAEVYRRSQDQKFMILFTKPREEAGKGYLRIDKNLWLYDPGTGKWERRTEREKIGGSNSRRSDFDESRLAIEFTVTPLDDEALGDYKAHVMELTVKEGIDVAYPKLKLWVDAAEKNVLKREEYALSGRLMRTSYYPSWIKAYSASKGGDVWIPKEMRVFDDLEKGNSTIILVKESDLAPLSDAIFTKAWVEGKSR